MSKKKEVPPSRKKYDEENPPLTIRVPKALKERFERHLAPSKQAPATFLKSILDKEQAVIDKRVNACVEQKFGAFSKRIKEIDNLMFQLLLTFSEKNLPALCPLCEDRDGYRLLLAWGVYTNCDGKTDDGPTWKCPHCEWFYDISGTMDPASVKWDDPEAPLAELRKKLPKKKG